MLYFFSGTDSDKARAAMYAAIEKSAKKASVLRITDAHTKPDLEASLQGPGMFGLPGQGAERVVVFDNVYQSDELREVLSDRIPVLAKSADAYFMLEGALDAATRKSVEKHAEEFSRFDEKKAAKKESVFELANALQYGKKKDLWVGYQKELHAGKAPEAIHGVLFWAAKQLLLKNYSPRARLLVAELAELPHEARRQGFELEYALEYFVLSRV